MHIFANIFFLYNNNTYSIVFLYLNLHLKVHQQNKIWRMIFMIYYYIDNINNLLDSIFRIHIIEHNIIWWHKKNIDIYFKYRIECNVAAALPHSMKFLEIISLPQTTHLFSITHAKYTTRFRWVRCFKATCYSLVTFNVENQLTNGLQSRDWIVILPSTSGKRIVDG